MHGSFSDGNRDFDAQIYLRILIAIAKSDPDNGAPEFNFVRRQARRWDLDYAHFLATTDKSYLLEKRSVSRRTALTILRDAILLASMDRNFTLQEKQRVYGYAEKLDITRKEIDQLELLVHEYRSLQSKWKQLIAYR
jgi:hypothetical protein